MLFEYLKAVAKYWWAIITGLGLTVVDGVERTFGTWYVFPLWARLLTGIGGIVFAQYCAYRELALTVVNFSGKFTSRLRETHRNAQLQWSLLDAPGATYTAQTICKQVDELAAALSRLYSECPDGIDAQPLRHAIESLHATKAHRLGNMIGSQHELDKVSKYMQAALDDIRLMLENM